MSHWYVGQKIVCINTDAIDGSPAEPEIQKNIKVGEVYIIRQILDFPFKHLGKKSVRLAFRLAGIRAASSIDADGKFSEYAFWSERFKPLEEDETSIDASVPEEMKDWLKQVMDGTVTFEEEKEKVKEEVE
jgi:hypothetical protein